MIFDPDLPWTGHVSLAEIVRNPKQPRRTFAQGPLELLAKSMKKNGQQVPATVIPYEEEGSMEVRWLLVDGERRLRACGLAGILTLWVSYQPQLAAVARDAAGLHGASFAANFCREGHTKAETIAAVAVELAAGRSRQEIAEAVGKSCQWVANYDELSKLSPRLTVLMDAPTPKQERLSIDVALKLVGWDHAKQERAWQHVRSEGRGTQLMQVRQLAPATNGNKAKFNGRFLLGVVNRGLQQGKLLEDVSDETLGLCTPDLLRQMVAQTERTLVSFQKMQVRLQAVTKKGDQDV